MGIRQIHLYSHADGVDPEVTGEIRHAVSHTPGVRDISEVRVRWLGHRLHAELNVAVDPGLSVESGHEIAKEVRHHLLHQLRYLSNATIHVTRQGRNITVCLNMNTTNCLPIFTESRSPASFCGAGRGGIFWVAYAIYPSRLEALFQMQV